MAGERIAFTFTGQGSQRVGMWDDLRESERAGSLFAEADQRLGVSLSTLCARGPIEELTKTSNAQPAIVAHSLAALLVTLDLHPELPEPVFLLGHSVGEYSALAVGGVIDMQTAIGLVRQRGLLMEKVNGQMAAVLGREPEEVEKLCKDSGAEIANINCPGQIIISGSEKSISKAIEIANDPRRVRLLPVSGPFHSTLMKPPKGEFEILLNGVPYQDSMVPIISNVDAKPGSRAEELKPKSVEQLASRVNWQQSVEYAISKGVTTFIEFGPNDTLTGLLKRINTEVRGIAVTDYQSAKELSL